MTQSHTQRLFAVADEIMRQSHMTPEEVAQIRAEREAERQGIYTEAQGRRMSDLVEEIIRSTPKEEILRSLKARGFR